MLSSNYLTFQVLQSSFDETQPINDSGFGTLINSFQVYFILFSFYIHHEYSHYQRFHQADEN